MENNKHNKIVRLLKHLGCNVTDMTAINPTIKLTGDVTVIQGIDVNNYIPDHLKISKHILYIVGDLDVVDTTMFRFCKAMQDDLELPVSFRPTTHKIMVKE